MDFHQIFHIVISIYVVFGWILYPQGHAPVCFAIVLHWLLNKGRCVFSDGYDDDNGFTTELLMKVGIDISGKEWLKKLIPYILAIIPGLVSVYMSIRDISFFGDIFAKNSLSVIVGGIILISIWQAGSRILGLASAADAGAAVGAEVPATGDVPQADADAAPPLK